MTTLGVIPARLAATRFPGKPLAVIAGRPMVQWVWEAATACPALSDVIVATPDSKILRVVEAFGGRAELTSDTHQTGTDRVAEVADRHPEAAVVVNIQGDQPFVRPDMLEELVRPFARDASVSMTTLGAPLDDERAMADPNTVKVVCDQNGDALYFSRSPIPYRRTNGPAPVFHHLGLYAFRRAFLSEFGRMKPTLLEQREALEQLRVLEHGFRIRVCMTPSMVIEVNTPEDLARACELAEGLRG